MGTISFIVIVGLALILGSFIYRNPLRMIEVQKKFYALINWRMEPISMEKEVRNTRWMGLFLIVFALGSLIYHITRS